MSERRGARPIRYRVEDMIRNKGLSLSQAASLIGVSPQKISGFCQGTTKLKEHEFGRLASWLFDMEGRVKPGPTPFADQTVRTPTHNGTFDAEVTYERVEEEIPRQSYEDLCQWIERLEQEVERLKERVSKAEQKFNRLTWIADKIKEVLT